MKLPFKKYREIISDIIKDIFLRKIDNRYIISSKSVFTFSGYSDVDRCLYLYPNREKPLYAIKVTNNNNIPIYLDNLKRILELFGAEDDARMFLFYTKSPVLFNNEIEDFCTKNSMYIFSHSKVLLDEVCNYFGDIELLKPLEIVRALLDIGLNNHYITNKDDYSISTLQDINTIPTDELAYIFKTLFAEGVYDTVSKDTDSKYKVYQAVGVNTFFAKDKPDMLKAISLDWQGYMAITLELNSNNIRNIIRAKRSLSSKIDVDKAIKNGYKLLEKKYEEEPSEIVIANIVLVTNNKKVIQPISEATNLHFIEKKIFKKDIIYLTPIRIRDIDFDIVLKTEDAKKFICSFLQKNVKESIRIAESAGKDITNNYTNFTFFTSSLPHSAVIAKARSGKTVFIENILADAMRANIEENKNYIADSRDILENSPVVITSAKRLINDEIGIVHFDVGHSAEKFVNQLSFTFPKHVDIYSDNLNLLRFGLTNVRTIEENGKIEIHKTDALFMIQTVNTILELSNQEMINSNESNKIINALAKVFADKSYQGITIKKLKELGGYEELLNRVEESIGKLDEYSTTVELNLPKEFRFLQVPLFSDVITELEMQKSNFRTNSEEKEVISSAIMKLKALEDNPMFWYYAKNNIKDSSYFYMELESIKKLGNSVFIPVYLMIFQSLYRRDLENAIKAKNKGKNTKEMIYIVEEAHNFFNVSSFRNMFAELSREAARYGIVLVFITQNANDVPIEILKNLGNKILMPAMGKDKEGQLSEIPYLFQLEDEQNKLNKIRTIEFFKKYSKRFYAVIQNSDGISTFMPYSSKEKVWLFNSDAVAQKY